MLHTKVDSFNCKLFTNCIELDLRPYVPFLDLFRSINNTTVSSLFILDLNIFLFKEILDLSGNQLSSFDENIHLFWTKSLRWVSVAGNMLSSIPWSICQLENLSSLDISRNRIESVPPPNYWSVKSLTKLNLSHNLVSALNFHKISIQMFSIFEKGTSLIS